MAFQLLPKGERESREKYDIVRFGSRPHPHGFVSGNSYENFLVGHPSWDGFVSGNSYENFLVGHPLWDCSRANSFNFGVPMEPEASELQKALC
ncbi:unnamed protein product [Malus baccata var. baccata]